MPGKPVIRQWPPTNKRDENLVDHFLLPHDHLADLGDDGFLRLLEAGDPLLQPGGIESMLVVRCGHSLFILSHSIRRATFVPV